MPNKYGGRNGKTVAGGEAGDDTSSEGSYDAKEAVDANEGSSDGSDAVDYADAVEYANTDGYVDAVTNPAADGGYVARGDAIAISREFNAKVKDPNSVAYKERLEDLRQAAAVRAQQTQALEDENERRARDAHAAGEPMPALLTRLPPARGKKKAAAAKKPAKGKGECTSGNVATLYAASRGDR
jgi:hypothetical protein